MARIRLHARCSWTSQANGRCKILVPRSQALQFPRGGRLPFYCNAHLDYMLIQNTARVKSQGAPHLFTALYADSYCRYHPHSSGAAYTSALGAVHVQRSG